MVNRAQKKIKNNKTINKKLLVLVNINYRRKTAIISLINQFYNTLTLYIYKLYNSLTSEGFVVNSKLKIIRFYSPFTRILSKYS